MVSVLNPVAMLPSIKLVYSLISDFLYFNRKHFVQLSGVNNGHTMCHKVVGGVFDIFKHHNYS